MCVTYTNRNPAVCKDSCEDLWEVIAEDTALKQKLKEAVVIFINHYNENQVTLPTQNMHETSCSESKE